MGTILITGSLGYFGTMVSSYLIAKGYNCIGFDIGYFRDSVLYPPDETETIIKDVRDITEADLQEVDAVIHLAGISNDPIKYLDAASVYDPCREYSLKVAKMCKKIGIRFIFASSCSVYGASDEQVNELSKLNPVSLYAESKIDSEDEILRSQGDYFHPTILRFVFSTLF